MNEQQEEIKDITITWVRRMGKLMDKKLLNTNPVVVYSAALSMCCQVMVACIMKFEEHQHMKMMEDMGKMLTGLYQIKMQETQRDKPRIILPH